MCKQKEFEEARKDLQVELQKGASVDEIRKKITKGEIQTKVAKQFKENRTSKEGRIQRKKRDLMQFLTKFSSRPIQENIPSEPRKLSALQQFVMSKEENIDGAVLNKKIYKIGDKELLVSTWHLNISRRIRGTSLKLYFCGIASEGTCSKLLWQDDSFSGY